ncbi:hypothetical protein [Isobaculum melis]|uniref:Uncharacterized conserved protein YfeS, contains WGR domain n=1 Tax=Isobaculum melis TaxID=142588 RepID=A0A1H9R900_9LACT|nr:hypothetical protein [Isobaculum melis]SER69015.1 Uncharacterized conserved protein YfeS, contains WGR domain [Isobaculum melis]
MALTFNFFNEERFYDIVDETTIFEALQELEHEQCEFLILECSNPREMSDNSFIQTAKEENGFIVETRFDYAEDIFDQFQLLVADRQDVAKLFVQYLNGSLPDVKQWKNISGHLKIYLDTVEDNVTRTQSHPQFLAHFNQDFYFDISLEEAPFGSDTGNDALAHFSEYIRKDGEIDRLILNDFPRRIVEDMWGMNYLNPVDTAELNDALYLSAQTTVAIAFGMAKVYGDMTSELHQAALSALHKLNNFHEKDHALYQQMIADLTAFEFVVEEE